LLGYIADKLGKSDVMAPFWRNRAKTPGVDEWVAVLGDEPILVLLDELPSYLQMAQGEPVGATTLGELTIGALERLFNALPQCKRACVVVTNLKDDVYLDGSAQLRTLVESLTKHYDRNAQAITPRLESFYCLGKRAQRPAKKPLSDVIAACSAFVRGTRGTDPESEITGLGIDTCGSGGGPKGSSNTW